MLHHIALPGTYQPGTAYTPEGYAQEGFIHLCTPAQLPGVLARYYHGLRPLHLLYLSDDIPGVKWEAATGGELFPHLYRAIEDIDVQQLEVLET